MDNDKVSKVLNHDFQSHTLKIVDLDRINWGSSDQQDIDHFFINQGMTKGLCIINKVPSSKEISINPLTADECDRLYTVNEFFADKPLAQALKKAATQLPDNNAHVPAILIEDTPTDQLLNESLWKKPLKVVTVDRQSSKDKIVVQGLEGSQATLLPGSEKWKFSPSQSRSQFAGTNTVFAIDPRQFKELNNVPVFASYRPQINDVVYTTKQSLIEGSEVVLAQNGYTPTKKNINRIAQMTIERSIQSSEPISRSLQQISHELKMGLQYPQKGKNIKKHHTHIHDR